VVEVGVRGDVAAGGGVVAPVVDVGVRAAGVAHRLDAGVAQEVGDLGCAELGVPDRVVDADRRVADRFQSAAGVDRDADGCRVFLCLDDRDAA
jgi:hypothetical protein